MTSAVNQSDRIQNAIVAAIRAFGFRRVSYNAQGERTTLPDTQPPRTVLVHEAESTFGEPVRNRRETKQERETWVWVATVAWDREVSVVEFEEALMASPIRLPRDIDFQQSATVSLSGVEYSSPAEQQPASGLRAVYRFNASLSPS